jgi:hypothetical protein
MHSLRSHCFEKVFVKSLVLPGKIRQAVIFTVILWRILIDRREIGGTLHQAKNLSSYLIEDKPNSL